jgi:hypothetical protein
MNTPHAENRNDLVFATGLERILDGLVPGGPHGEGAQSATGPVT